MIRNNGEPLPTAEEMRAMREDELLDLIRETVQQLNTLGDRLEKYAEERVKENE